MTRQTQASPRGQHIYTHGTVGTVVSVWPLASGCYSVQIRY